MSFTSALSGFADNVKDAASAHSTGLCLAAGILGFATSIALACRATITAEERLDEYNERKNKIEELKHLSDEGELEEEYTEEEYNKDLFNAKVKLIVGLIRKYLPAAIATGISIGFFCEAVHIEHGKYVTAMGACAAIDEEFRKYRERTKEEVGEEKEWEIRTGAKKKSAFVKKTTEEGEEEVVEEEVRMMDMDDIPAGSCALFSADTTNGTFDRSDPVNNERLFQLIENQANNELFANGWILESQVRKWLGLEITPDSLIKGWIIDPANPPLDSHPIRFNPQPVFSETGDRILSTGRLVKEVSSRGWILQFNTQVIWNLVWMWEDKKYPRMHLA